MNFFNGKLRRRVVMDDIAIIDKLTRKGTNIWRNINKFVQHTNVPEE